jgi:Helix-turn-helix domain
VSRASAIDGIAQAVARQLADPDFLDLIADHVVERLDERDHQPQPRLVDPKEAAALCGVEVQTIYDWKRQGRITPAIKPKAQGGRPRLRFDRDQLLADLGRQPDPKPSRRRRRRPRSGAELLPIRGAGS